jgi:hypothetical protein
MKEISAKLVVYWNVQFDHEVKIQYLRKQTRVLQS